MAFEKIIVLDDELVIRKSLQEQLRKRKYAVAAASTIAEAHKLLQKDSFDLIFVDLGLPDGDGREFLEAIMSMDSPPVVVVMTGDSSIKTAVDCIHKGAFDYIIKPFHIEQIDIAIKKAESFKQLVQVNRQVTEDARSSISLLGESAPMLKLREMVQKVAATEATVLICGENGTGKELIAHELFAQSSRADKPYIKVNCAAISETLMESEFFGHEKGAFTGATQKREGRFELANSGTILLDEISEISLRLQSKLLRVLQEREFERVGGNKTLHVDVRVLATTNRDLMQFVQDGNFREDLYYRLNVFPLQVPPLRDRDDDAAILSEAFLERFSRKHRKEGLKFSKAALKAIRTHAWPGNVRELQNTIERAVILTDDKSAVAEDALGLMPTPDALSLASLQEMEKEHILKALEKAEGKRKKAAELLDISEKALSSKLEKIQ